MKHIFFFKTGLTGMILSISCLFNLANTGLIIDAQVDSATFAFSGAT
ncbi:MAG: hypothetical protein HRT52_21385 [Colwellia sp.]|nr:hypothetical protein [Colwellia sp.]